MQIVNLGSLATIDLSNIDKKSKENEPAVRLCNFVDVYYNWAITSSMVTSFMEATATPKQIEKFSLKRGMIAITKDSETRDDIGVSTYIADNLEDVVLGYHCALITPKVDYLDGKYLNAILHTKYAQKYFENNASGSGQRYTLTSDIISNFPVPLMELAIQKRIGSIFSHLDEKISINNQINDNLSEQLRKIYEYWFIQFDFPFAEGKGYKSVQGKMKWSNIFKREIPEAWKEAKMKDIASLERGISYTSDMLTSTGIPMINLGSFAPDGSYKPENLKYITSKTDISYVDKDDLVLCMTQQSAPDLAKDIAGKTLIVPTFANDKICISQDLAKVVVDPEYRYYIYEETRQMHYCKYIIKFATGTSIYHLSPDGFLEYPLLIPDTRTLTAFNTIAREILEKQDAIKQENAQLKQLMEYLLPLLLSGQLDI